MDKINRLTNYDFSFWPNGCIHDKNFTKSKAFFHYKMKCVNTFADNQDYKK